MNVIDHTKDDVVLSRQSSQHQLHVARLGLHKAAHDMSGVGDCSPAGASAACG
jgi:hypothetical protein